jgi:hypothetical protein
VKQDEARDAKPKALACTKTLDHYFKAASKVKVTVQSEDKDERTCDACALINLSFRRSCECCGTKRSAGTARYA